MADVSSTSVLSVRVSSDERGLLEAAAEQANTSLSDFIRRKSLEAAEIEVLHRSVVVIPSQDWDAFEAWAKRPPSVNAGLSDLVNLKPTWER